MCWRCSARASSPASLIARFGAERVDRRRACCLLIGCALVGLAGTSVGHFWLALILLGFGWNFGFIGGPRSSRETYRPEEKEKVQALNDFLIFGVVAVASFSSGEILHVRRLEPPEHHRAAGVRRDAWRRSSGR